MAKILAANEVGCFNQVLLEDPLLDILITEATEVIPTYSKCVHCCLCLASSPGPTQKRRRALSRYSLIPRPHPLRRTSHMCWVSIWCNSTCLTWYHIVSSQLQLEFLWQDHRSYSIECEVMCYMSLGHIWLHWFEDWDKGQCPHHWGQEQSSVVGHCQLQLQTSKAKLLAKAFP